MIASASVIFLKNYSLSSNVAPVKTKLTVYLYSINFLKTGKQASKIYLGTAQTKAWTPGTRQNQVDSVLD